MRIGVEMRLVTMGDAGGIAVLLRGVLRSLFERNAQHQFICFHTIFNRGLFGDVPGNVEAHTLTLGGYFAEIGKLCAEKQVDVLFRGYPLEQNIAFDWSRQIVQIPDIQHEQFPEFFEAETLRSRRAAFGRVLESAGAIGTISEFSRQELLARCGSKSRDIFLMCPALQAEHREQAPLLQEELALVPPGDFFLYPANLWKHKNHERVLRAFEQCLETTRHPAELVLTGHPRGWEEYQKRFGHLPVRHLGYVRPALLRRLLERARALAFFSLYEGFGMPLLEAFDAGTPVICSNTTSLPEVGGDAVLSCDPADINAMSALMERILKEPALRGTLAERGRERLKAYTWEQAADNLMAACERVAERADADARMMERVSVADGWPRVGLVTPSFNQGRFIRRTIDSVLSQNYPHIDYLVMDGGSTDETLEVLRSYGERARWNSEPDRGQAEAINKGLARVQGEVLGYLNSDDVLLPGALAKAARHLKERPQCDMVYGRARFIDEEDRVIGNYPTDDYSFERLMADCCISQPAAFWRKSIAEKVGEFNELLHFALDYDYWQRMHLAGGGIEHIHEHLACTRMHAQAKTMSKHAEMMREAIEVCKKNAGFASLAYYQGLWHSMAQGRRLRGLLLRRVPGLRPLVTRLQHGWENHRTYSSLDVAAETRRTLMRHVHRAFMTAKAKFRKAGVKIGYRGNRPSVLGYWGDNWIEERCLVRLHDSAAGEELVLRGRANEPMQVAVTVNGRASGVFDLQAGAVEQVRFQVGPGPRRTVGLTFSKHLVDGAKRRLSFLVEGTNLFSEQDMG